jgi:hypothetical protein
MEFILEIPNSIPKHKCKEIISRFENDTKKMPGVAGQPPQVVTVKRSMDLCFSGHGDWKDIDIFCQSEITRGLKKYKEYLQKIGCSMNSSMVNCTDTGYQIQKTEQGQFYGWHNDSSMSTNRVITFIWYLTSHDPIEDGGGTAFHQHCAGGKVITPEEGKLVFFPATWTYVHAGLPLVSKRPKYIITGWLSCDKM